MSCLSWQPGDHPPFRSAAVQTGYAGEQDGVTIRRRVLVRVHRQDSSLDPNPSQPLPSIPSCPLVSALRRRAFVPPHDGVEFVS
jgi:hypothetical protein